MTEVQESLHPEILFHFTKKEALKSILEHTFSVSYAREVLYSMTQKREYAIPMVSFCDLRLSELKAHMNKYGTYGIGLSKEWANRKGLNPVLYVSKYSNFTDGFINGVTKLHNQLRQVKPSDQAQMDQAFENILNTYRFLKNYESEITRDNYTFTQRHADEREWRFVPELSNTIDYPILPISKLKRDKASMNNLISDIKLSFEPDDIRYLIINDEAEISEFISHLNDVKGKYSQDTIQKLVSRILTANQIKMDV